MEDLIKVFLMENINGLTDEELAEKLHYKSYRDGVARESLIDTLTSMEDRNIIECRQNKYYLKEKIK